MEVPIDMAIDAPLLDQLLTAQEPQQLFANVGLTDALSKALLGWMLAAELDDHLETEAEAGLSIRRHGSSNDTMLPGPSKMTLDFLRDQSGTFFPKLIA
jgi:putative transposase